MVTVSLLHACGGALRRAGAGRGQHLRARLLAIRPHTTKKAPRARPASAVVAVCEFSHKSWSARWRRSCRQTAQDRCLPCPPRARPKRGWTGARSCALVLPLPSADCRAEPPRLNAWAARARPPRRLSCVCVCFRAWRLEHLASSVSCVVACRSLPATCQRYARLTPARVRLTGRHGGRYPMVLAIGACGHFMELSLAARAMPWHSRVRGCLFFCGFVECGVRPPVQDLAYKPQHKRARLASRPRQRGGEGLEFGCDRRPPCAGWPCV